MTSCGSLIGCSSASGTRDEVARRRGVGTERHATRTPTRTHRQQRARLHREVDCSEQRARNIRMEQEGAAALPVRLANARTERFRAGR